MPTNRVRTIRKKKTIIPLDESVKHFLLYGTAKRNTPGWSLMVSDFFDGEDEIRAAWEAHKKELMDGWTKRAKPWAWKEFEKGGSHANKQNETATRPEIASD
jgi:hypothetical protein